MEITTHTQLCAVLGNPVEHSLSPAIHNAAFRHLDLDFVYMACRVEDLEGAIRGIRALGNLRGFSVTIPHKVALLPFLDEIEETARHIGSVNTIVKEQKALTGYNTDASGALTALKVSGVERHGQRVLILGSGGAARAIAFGLSMEAEIAGLTILGIDDHERRMLARDLRERTSIDVQDQLLDEQTVQEAIPRHTILIHCTPLGMSPKIENTCVPKQFLRPELTVMDIVYNPLETRLLREAKVTGCRTIRGLEMFLYQAAAQFELWTQKAAPIGVMRNVLEKHFS